MKKILLILFITLFSSSLFAEVNEPGSGKINYWDDFEKWYTKQLKKAQKKKQKLIFYGSTSAGGWAAGQSFTKEINDKSHAKAYKLCMKNAKKWTQKDCYLFAIDDEVVWNFDAVVEVEKVILPKIIINAADEKPGRFFEDQPDVNDDYQIHFIYLLAKDGKDREWDINGKMESILLEMNEIMARETEKKSKGTSKKYKFDYRKDGKIDITFIRLTKNEKDLHKYRNNNIAPFLWINKFNNPKKIYYTFADIGSVDGGEAGVPMGSTYLGAKYNNSKEQILKITLHELHHAQGGGFICVPGMAADAHWKNRDKKNQLGHGLALGATYIHNEEGCPQLVDSVYLTPTSEDPYDPYKIICLEELSKYNHPKIIKGMKKKPIHRGGIGSGCKWKMGGSDFYTDAGAAQMYEQTGGN